MTVVVGVLNTKGVAIAADSASTQVVAKMGEERKEKIVNSGNKMLRLSDSDSVHVGVMIVDTADILGMPWDVIIRWYRKQKSEKNISTVLAIAKEFLDFIQKQDFFTNNLESLTWEYTTELVFAGYGTEEINPALVHITVNGVKDGNLKYEVTDECTITDDHDSEIRYYGQVSIIDSLIGGAKTNDLIKDSCKQILDVFNETQSLMGRNIPSTFKMPNYSEILLSAFDEYYQTGREKWLERIKGYSLEEMADLAKNLVNATELYQKMTFQKESVGGLIDLAVISKADRFQWHNRKSWYEPSRGGQYGKFGI